jgi:hypothetical protein
MTIIVVSIVIPFTTSFFISPPLRLGAMVEATRPQPLNQSAITSIAFYSFKSCLVILLLSCRGFCIRFAFGALLSKIDFTQQLRAFP